MTTKTVSQIYKKLSRGYCAVPVPYEDLMLVVRGGGNDELKFKGHPWDTHATTPLERLSANCDTTPSLAAPLSSVVTRQVPPPQPPPLLLLRILLCNIKGALTLRTSTAPAMLCSNSNDEP